MFLDKTHLIDFNLHLISPMFWGRKFCFYMHQPYIEYLKPGSAHSFQRLMFKLNCSSAAESYKNVLMNWLCCS